MKTLLLILLPFVSFCQSTVDYKNLITRSQEIRHQTRPGGNTAEKVGSLFEDLARQVLLVDKLRHKLDSLINNRPNLIEHPLKVSKPEKGFILKPTFHDQLGNEL